MPSTVAKVFVDLSNVLRDEALGRSLKPADWSRWERLRPAVERYLGAGVTYVLVADTNLYAKLSRGDQSRFDAERTRGRLQSRVDADRTMLQDAINEGAMVLSNDRFTDHMRMQGITGLTILRWRSSGRSITITSEHLQRPMSVRITQRQEKEERKVNWADTEVIRQRWRCRNAACSEGLVRVPNMRQGSPRCPRCDAYLAQEGEWRDAVEVKILVGDDVVRRITLQDGQSLVLGREDAAGQIDISSHLPEDQRSRISRRHVRLSNKEGRLLVEDMDSTNGTSLLAPSDRKLRRRAWMPPRELPANQATELKEGHRAALAKARVFVELSGRSYGRHGAGA